MHPFHPGFFHHHHFRRGGPSRLFWFVIGAGAATFWHHSHEMHAHGHYWHCVSHANRRRRVEDTQVPQQVPATTYTGASVPLGSAPAPAFSGPATFPSPLDNGTQPIPPQPPRWAWANAGQSSDGTFGWNQKEWEEDKERLRELQRRAQDTMVEMSESTLDSILSTVESMKGKLAEHRTLREQQQKQYEEELERAKKEPRRYV